MKLHQILEYQGKKYQLDFSFNLVCELEERMEKEGRALMQVLRTGSYTMRDLRTFFQEAVTTEDGQVVDAKTAGKLLTVYGPGKFIKEFPRLISQGADDEDQPEGGDKIKDESGN